MTIGIADMPPNASEGQSEQDCSIQAPPPSVPSDTSSTYSPHYVGDLCNERAHQYFREEVRREDEITNQRLTSALSLQGFLLAAVALILSNGIADNVPTRELLVQLRQGALLAIIASGLASSFVAYLGIRASRSALRSAVARREAQLKAKILKPEEWFPQAHGSGIDFKAGNLFPVASIVTFIVIWVLIGAGYYLLVIVGTGLPWVPREAPVDRTQFVHLSGRLKVDTPD